MLLGLQCCPAVPQQPLFSPLVEGLAGLRLQLETIELLSSLYKRLMSRVLTAAKLLITELVLGRSVLNGLLAWSVKHLLYDRFML